MRNVYIFVLLKSTMAIKVNNYLEKYQYMQKTIIVEKSQLPDFLPHGWKTQVAKILGIHPNTVKNAIQSRKGETYEKIKQVAITKWGQ